MILLMAALAPLFVDASENNAIEGNKQDSAYLPEKPTVDPREIFQVFKVEPPQEELKVNKDKYDCPHCQSQNAFHRACPNTFRSEAIQM